LHTFATLEHMQAFNNTGAAVFTASNAIYLMLSRKYQKMAKRRVQANINSLACLVN